MQRLNPKDRIKMNGPGFLPEWANCFYSLVTNYWCKIHAKPSYFFIWM